MTVSLAAVFIPVLFLGGILGRLFREFAVTITAAIRDFRAGVGVADADAVQPLAAQRGRKDRRRGRWLDRAFDRLAPRLRPAA